MRDYSDYKTPNIGTAKSNREAIANKVAKPRIPTQTKPLSKNGKQPLGK